MASFEEPDAWTWAAMEPEPSNAEKALFETFCREFLVDRSYVRAASRCGFQAQFAVEYGKLLYAKSYVQKRLAEMERQKPNEKQEKEFDAVNTRARLRAIINDESQKASARVAAARELNAMHGLHAATKINMNTNTRGSGVIVVPVGTLDEWEKMATASQQKLIEESRVD